MDSTIDELVSHPINLNEAFVIRTATGGIVSTSLYGLSDVTTFPKTYHFLRLSVHLEQIGDMYLFPPITSAKHQKKLESVLAFLSDAQFDRLVRILACSPGPRIRKFLEICAMLPEDLERLQEAQAERLSPQGLTTAAQEPSPPALQLFQQHMPNLPTIDLDELLSAHIHSDHPIFLRFSIDDMSGAADLLLKLALHMQQTSLGVPISNIELLHRFASLSDTISAQLLMAWESKWPVIWEGVDTFTLDLTTAYGPDGVFLPTKQWLADVSRFRNATPAWLRILAPTRELETAMYEAYGIAPQVQ